MSLYPTPTRLSLMREIANGQVLTDITRDDHRDVIVLFPDAPTSWQEQQVVTARVRELEAAGWTEECVAEWHLTAEGHDVLSAAKGGAS